MLQSIKSQLVAFGAAAAAFIALMGGTGLVALQQVQRALADTTRDAVAIRNHIQGDMLHDALRADVFAGLLAAKAGHTEAIGATRAEADARFKEFREVMQANLQAHLSPEIDNALKALQPEVQAYGAQAVQLLGLMATDLAAAERDMPTFITRFDRLAQTMSAARDRIQAQVLETQRAADERANSSMLGVAGVGALAIALATVTGWLLYRRINQPLQTLHGVVQRVNAGEMQARAQLTRQDELGAFSRAFDQLLDERIASLEKAARENEQLNNSVIALLQTVFQLSNKDLTVRAEVSEDVIGTLSASINQLSDATGHTLAEVAHIAERVREASEFVSQQAERVDQTAQNERQALERMAGELSRAVKQLVQVAQLSDHSNKAAEKAAAATDGALRAVSATVRGMDELRESISETEKRFKRLGERSQEISSVVSLINTISERTHMLAMNASMQAATAGEAGRGFAVVAEEVQRLSESSRQATQQIGQLVHNIQVETNETLYTMNRLITQVVAQSEQAQAAGTQMTETQTTTAQLVQLVRQIAEFSDQQSLLARELQLSVSKLNKGSEQTVNAVGEQTRSTATLVSFSRRLAEAVSQFKLPEPA